jgi:hypothetical protein
VREGSYEKKSRETASSTVGCDGSHGWEFAVVHKYGASAQAPDSVCVLKVDTNGKLLGVLVDRPNNVNIAVPLPISQSIRAPVLCEGLNSLALAVANQEKHDTAFSVELFTHNGESFCFKDGFELQVNGGAGLTFADCQ